jgi:hypothetical protein
MLTHEHDMIRRELNAFLALLFERGIVEKLVYFEEDPNLPCRKFDSFQEWSEWMNEGWDGKGQEPF